jgi:hypothetical protein
MKQSRRRHSQLMHDMNTSDQSTSNIGFDIMLHVSSVRASTAEHLGAHVNSPR